MGIVETLIAVIASTAAVAVWAIALKPKGTARVNLRGFNRGWLLIAIAGVIAALGYSWFVYRHGTDGGWWPVIACLYSSAWIIRVTVSGSILRWLRFRGSETESGNR